ncbi:hypothetical protein [uncultured Sphingomonas sp.]|jgi:hypothetical protein|uniref:hypothetical protein n=1 Tax=uncultured Sphingomonas sp. TaxID=158754 RepID=UPI0030D71945
MTMMRTYDFDNDFEPFELAKLLRESGIPGDVTLDQIIAGAASDFDADEEIAVTVTVDEDDVIEKLHDDAIIDAYRDMGLTGGETRSIEDGFRYVRDGDLPMARAMFERVFEDADLDAAMRGLA